MVNRLRYLTDCPPEPGRQTEYYEVRTFPYGGLVVSLEGALEILRQLDAIPTPEWIEFRDLFGARRRILANYVVGISESTPEIRRAHRAFDRAREKEEEDDEDKDGWKDKDF